MYIICEGFERTGKTTLARALARDLDLPLARFGVPPTAGVLQHFLTEIEVQRSGRGLVVDRLHLSNYAYAGRLGGGVLTAEEWSAIDAYLARRFSALLLLVDSPFAIERRLRQEGPSEASGMTREQIGATCGRFSAAFAASNVPHKRSLRLPDFLDPATSEPTEHYRRFVELIRDRLQISPPDGASAPI